MFNNSATSTACCFLQGHDAWTLGLGLEKINCFLTVSFSALNHTRAVNAVSGPTLALKVMSLCVCSKQCEHLNYFLHVWAAFAFIASVTSTQIVLTCHNFGFECKTIHKASVPPHAMALLRSIRLQVALVLRFTIQRASVKALSPYCFHSSGKTTKHWIACNNEKHFRVSRHALLVSKGFVQNKNQICPSRTGQRCSITRKSDSFGQSSSLPVWKLLFTPP